MMTPPHGRPSPRGERPATVAPSRVAFPLLLSLPRATVATILLPPHHFAHSLPPPLPERGGAPSTHDRALALCVLSSGDNPANPATAAVPAATMIALLPHPLHPREGGSGGEEVRHAPGLLPLGAAHLLSTSPSPRDPVRPPPTPPPASRATRNLAPCHQTLAPAPRCDSEVAL